MLDFLDLVSSCLYIYRESGLKAPFRCLQICVFFAPLIANVKVIKGASKNKKSVEYVKTYVNVITAN